MLQATLLMAGLGAFCGLLLGAASRIFYVYEDPRIEQVQDSLAGANCGGCGYAGCAAAAHAVVAGKAPVNVCMVGGDESAVKVAEIMGIKASLLEPQRAFNLCTGGHRASNHYIYEGINTCRAQSMLYGGKRVCSIGCLGFGDCVKACQFGALTLGPDGYPVTDMSKCVGCGACEKACPKDILKVRTLSDRFLHFNTEDDCLAPCAQTCPAQINIPRYITQIRNGDYEGAVHTIRERNPLLLACGRVCPHPCEVNCRRGLEDEPVSINQLKRFAADYEMNSGKRMHVSVAPEKTGKKVAIVGGGPAGLTCAFFLRRLGHDVTIFDSKPKLGGVLRYGIPEYRLPKKVLDWEIEGILNLGIETKTNHTFGKDYNLESLIGDGFDAIFLGIGAWKDSPLRVEGEILYGCYTGMDFLSRLAKGDKMHIGKTAVVIGGGNTAIDCSRNLIRHGVEKVYIVYRRTRNEMPANKVEVEAAEHEGVQFLFLSAPIRVKGDNEGKVTHLEYERMELGEPDASGRRRPVPVKDSATLLATDMVITAIGQAPDLAFAQKVKEKLSELKTTKWNTLDVNPDTWQTSIPFIFSAGDAATGPSLVVEAIGGGRKAARSIHQYITGQEVKCEPGELKKSTYIKGTMFDHVDGIEKKPRAEMVELPVEERIKSFVEVDQVLTEEEAIKESKRCLNCCRICYTADVNPLVKIQKNVSSSVTLN
ncbi:MAG: FAD-dependent oxidoreductase [Deltaproteobacteria bacterium]|nr:FAD-dependent oxidoreductase [Deltaproteobacteria bacterium]